MQSQIQTIPLSQRLKKVLEELENIAREVENAEQPSNDNGDDFLIR